MECRILRLPYTITKGRKHPVVPGADPKHGYMREDQQWWSVRGQKVNSSEKQHPLLCYLWEEKEDISEGLFAVFTDPANWKIIDPKNTGQSLADYETNNSDWLTYRCDCKAPDPEDKDKQIELVNKQIRLETKPTTKPTALNPLVVGDAAITNLWPTVGSNNDGDRVSEASAKPTVEMIR